MICGTELIVLTIVLTDLRSKGLQRDERKRVHGIPCLTKVFFMNSFFTFTFKGFTPIQTFTLFGSPTLVLPFITDLTP